MAIDQSIPAYRILEKQGFHDGVQLWQQGAAVYWEGVPNDKMEPLNEMASLKLGAYLDEMDKYDEAVAKAKGARWVPKARPQLGAFAQMRPEIVHGDGGIPIMGKRTAKGARPVVENVEAPLSPQQAARKGIDTNTGLRVGAG